MPKNTNKYHAEVVRVIDGDTFEMMIELGFGVTQKFSVRLDGIDTPEVSTVKGRQVKEFVRNLIEGKSVLVTDEGAEKYGRASAIIELAKIHPDKELINLNCEKCSVNDLKENIAESKNLIYSDFNGVSTNNFTGKEVMEKFRTINTNMVVLGAFILLGVAYLVKTK